MPLKPDLTISKSKYFVSHWGFPPARLATVSARVYGTLPFAIAATGSIPGTKAAGRAGQRSSLKPLSALVAELRYTFIHPWLRKKAATVRKNSVGDLKCYGLNNSKGSLKAMGVPVVKLPRFCFFKQYSYLHW